MEVRIGIVQSMKEIEVVLPEDAKREKVMKEIETSLGGRHGALAHRSQRSPGRRAGRANRLRGVGLSVERAHRRFRLGLRLTGVVR